MSILNLPVKIMLYSILNNVDRESLDHVSLHGATSLQYCANICLG